MNALRREWGAITFVVTILVGAVAVAISLGISATHSAPLASAPPCPTYTPYVVTPIAGADRDAKARGEREAHTHTDANTAADADGQSDPVQPRAPGLPDGTASADSRADTNPQGDPDRRGCNTDAGSDRDTDSRADDPTQLHAIADRDTDAQRLRLIRRSVRGRRAACCRSRG